MNSNSKNDIDNKIIIQQNKEGINLNSNNEESSNIENQNNTNDNNLISSNNFNNSKTNYPGYLLEKINSKSINDYVNSLLFEIKKLNQENEELKLNFVQVSELREKESQTFKYNLNVLKSNIEILEQEKQRHINQNIIEKENLENQIQILMKENNILNQRIKQVIEQNELLNKQIFDLNITNFGKNKKFINQKENKNKINKNNRVMNSGVKNNNKYKKDKDKNKNINVFNSNLRSKNEFSINLKEENKIKNNILMKASKTPKFNENSNVIKFDKDYSIEINKFKKDIINNKSNLNNNSISKDSTSFNIIENVSENFDSKVKENNTKFIPQKFNKFQLNNNIEKKENIEIEEKNEINNEILHFANKYLNNQNNDIINLNRDLLLKNNSIEIENNTFEKGDKMSINNSKNNE